MTTTLQLPDDLVHRIELHAARQGANFETAVAELLRVGLSAAQGEGSAVHAALLARRQELIQQFVAGNTGVELNGFEEGRDLDRRKAKERADAWRD